MALESPDKGNTACALLSDCHIHKAVEGPSVLYYIHQTWEYFSVQRHASETRSFWSSSHRWELSSFKDDSDLDELQSHGSTDKCFIGVSIIIGQLSVCMHVWLLYTVYMSLLALTHALMFCYCKSHLSAVCLHKFNYQTTYMNLLGGTCTKCLIFQVHLLQLIHPLETQLYSNCIRIRESHGTVHCRDHRSKQRTIFFVTNSHHSARRPNRFKFNLTGSSTSFISSHSRRSMSALLM